jgi:hypothetical protein
MKYMPRHMDDVRNALAVMKTMWRCRCLVSPCRGSTPWPTLGPCQLGRGSGLREDRAISDARRL